jgi:hypothetical protein
MILARGIEGEEKRVVREEILQEPGDPVMIRGEAELRRRVDVQVDHIDRPFSFSWMGK